MDYAETLYAARTGSNGAEQGLTQLINDYLHTSDIVRATATTELGNYLSQNSLATLASAVHDESALVRMGAASSLESLPMDLRWQLGKSLLSDPMRSVRIAAVGLLAGTPPTQMTTTELANFNAALKEFMAEQQLNADLPETHVNLGNMYAAEGKYTEAEQAYRKAIEMDDLWAPAYANLADLLRKTQRETESEAVLQQGILKSPKTAALHYALGLLNIRQKNLAAAINALQRAAELAPQNTQFTYVYALALSEIGQKPKAVEVIERALKATPGDRSLNTLRLQLAQPAMGTH
jgi:tetratricopeptide (TPR) repeat protein